MSEIPTDRPLTPATPRTAPSLVILNTGDGKGKSSSAFGVVVRAVARDWNVAVIQFLKSGNWNTGEESVCRERLGVDWWAIGEGFTWDSNDLTEDQAIANAAWEHARSCVESGTYQLVVLDEITYPLNWGWLAESEVLDAVKQRPERTSVVITGRDASQDLIDIADAVTEMRNVKHAYERGILAKKGIDY